MHPLHHLRMGLTLRYILDFAINNKKSVALTNVVHILATMRWVSFPGIHIVAINFSNLHSNTMALLGYDL